MAVGDITYPSGTGAGTVRVEIMASATATSSAPSSATGGIRMHQIRSAFGGTVPEVCKIVVKSTAGSGAMSVTLRLWEQHGAAATDWAPSGIGADATKGILNGGAAIGETGTDVINHVEPVAYLGMCDAIDVQVTAIAGASTAITVYLQAELASARAR